jgi:two-component system, chemotaxis family, response regulator Rcp1
MANKNLKPIDVLLVEDNAADARLMQETLKDTKVLVILSIVKDGIEAMAYLRNQGSYKSAKRPDVILLDLNLPRKDGREVLTEVKGDPSLHRIPVVIVTSSQAEQDIIKSYDLHANAYVNKPMDLTQFSAVVSAIDDFWFSVVKLPDGE